MAKLYNIARMTTATTGTGTITLGSAVAGFISFASAGVQNGDTVTYGIEDGTSREIGRGVYTSSGTTLTRSVIKSTNSNALISLSGSAQVFITACAEDIAPQTAQEQSTVRGNLYAAPFDAMAHLNFIINGAMEISQEIGTSTKSLGTGDNSAFTYNLDQWFTYKLASNNWNVRQVADGPIGFSKCLDYNAAATQAMGATHFHSIGQFIEGSRLARLGFGTANAGKITLGFWCKSDSTGTGWVTFTNSGNNRVYRASYSISAANTWEYKTITIDADQSGIWSTDNTIGLRVAWCLGSGSSAQSANLNAWASDGTVDGGGSTQTNFVPAASNYYRLCGAFLIPTADAPSAARSIIFRNSIAEELDACMRYYETSYDFNTAAGTATSVGAVEDFITGASSFFFGTTSNSQGGTVHFKKPKRTTPGITTWSPATGTAARFRDVANSADVVSATDQIGQRSFQWLAQNSAALNIRRYTFHWAANARM